MKSSCTCSQCSRCCKFLPGALIAVSDLDRLEAATREAGESEEVWAKRMFVASAGAVLGDSATGQRIEVPTLALKSARNGHCVYFRNGRCGIYEARPSACSHFDSCKQTDAEAQAVGLPMHLERLAAFESGSRYARLWKMLDAAGQRRSRASLDKRVRKLNRRKG